MKHIHKRLPSLAVAIVAILVLATGCSGDPSRSDVLADLAARDIVPMYERLEQSAAMLASSTTKLCDNADDTALADARVALAEMRNAWSQTEAAWIGPVMDRRSWAVVDWPISINEIEQLIADTDADLDVERLGKAIGADQRGLGAVEYVLGEPGTEVDAPAQFVLRRCEYLVGVAQVIHNESEFLLADWTTGNGGQDPYTDQISAQGSTALDSLINETLFLLEDIGDRELGVALGAVSGEADIERIIEGPSGLATSDIAGHLSGLRTVLIGDEAGHGLRPLLGEAISGRLVEQFDAADSAAAAVGSPLRDQVIGSPVQVEALRQAVKAIQVTVATEVVSRLGVTIGFSDADGDTGA